MRDLATTFETINVQRVGRVLRIELNRPKALNALNSTVMKEVLACSTEYDADPNIGCIMITGNDRAFAAGADITELNTQDFTPMYNAEFFAGWDRFAALRTPKLAAIGGYALGGGCELAMMCDVLIAGSNAKFGQPEIKIGCFPGMGGTQRLTRLVGRAIAMDMILTGRMIDAQEAKSIGLVSRVIDAELLQQEAMDIATTIASYPKNIAMMARACVNEAEDMTLSAGMRHERQTYYSLFGLPEQQEGMTAFIEKREPQFR